MIFRPELARRIARGQKTMTRRPVKPNETACRYRPDKSYAVQPGRGQSATCRIHVDHVHQELAGEITHADAVSEGFRTSDDFKAYWIALHDAAWLRRERTWVESCDTENVDVETFLHARSLDRFNERHAHKPVWVIAFRLDTAPVGRFLALRSQELYTSNPARALPDEPEAVDLDTQAWITERAGMTTQQWQAAEAARHDHDRYLLSLEDRVRAAQIKARMRNIDTSRETWMLRNLQARGRSQEMVAKRVEVLERKAYTSGLDQAA